MTAPRLGLLPEGTKPPHAAAPQHWLPPLLRLPPLAGVPASDKPPVRIFLGTEDAQFEAERIFLYSVVQTRDPARCYEIHLMKRLAGFRQRFWRTGFTNYRFAIPDFAGGEGKAIYNDVDQVYTRDPAELFDLDMDGHGYRSVSAEDTSVMLIDCARMQRWWNRKRAARLHKHLLLKSAMRVPGLWGPLDGGWNARDDEYVEGRSGLLHFTALHTQPWRPAPTQYSYHPNPLGEVWFRLKRRADAEAYQPWTADAPSADLPAAPAAGSRRLPSLEAAPVADLPWLLAARFRGGEGPVALTLQAAPDPASAAVHPRHRLQRDPHWWLQRVLDAAATQPQRAWTLRVRDGGREYCWQSRPLPERWNIGVVASGDARRDAPLLATAEALGLVQSLHPADLGDALSAACGHGDDLHLLLGGGRDYAAAAADQAGRNGGPLWLQLGTSGTDLRHFDQVILQPQDSLPLDDHTLALPLPLPVLPEARLSAARQRALAQTALGEGQAVTLLLDAPPLDDEALRGLVEAAVALAGRDRPLLLAALPGTAEASIAAARQRLAGLGGGGWQDHTTHDATADGWDAAAGATAIAADIVCGDHSALAPALAHQCGGRLHLLRGTPARPPAVENGSRRLQALIDSTRKPSYRGTPRQQDWRGRVFDAGVRRGLLPAPEAPWALAAQLVRCGLAQWLDAEREASAPLPPPAIDLLRFGLRRRLGYRPLV